MTAPPETGDCNWIVHCMFQRHDVDHIFVILPIEVDRRAGVSGVCDDSGDEDCAALEPTSQHTTAQYVLLQILYYFL